MADIFSEETDTIFQELSFVTDFAIDKENNKNIDETKEEINNKDIHNKEEREGKQIIDLCKHSDAIDPEQIFSAIEKLVNPDLDTEQRLKYAERIAKYLHLDGSEKETLLNLSSILADLEKEDEETIDGILEELPVYVLFCKTNYSYFNLVVRQHLVPYVMKQFSINCLQVRKKAHSALYSMLENNLVDSSQLSEWICPFISHIVTVILIPLDIQIEDINVMIKISPLVGKDLTVKFFLEPFVSLCEVSNSIIRQVCAYNLHYLIDVVGPELSESTLLLSFVNLCNDEQWEIRKACAAVFVETAKSFSRKIREEILTDIFMNLLSSSHNVREIAYQNLGDFISSFATSMCSSCDTPSNEIFKSDQEQYNHLHTWNMNNNESKTSDISIEDSNDKNVNQLHNVDCFKSVDGHRNINNNLTFVCSPFSTTCEISQTTNTQHKVNKIETNSTESGQKVVSDVEDKSSALNSLSDIRESLPALRKAFETELSKCLSHNENIYNDFSYWKIPILEIESDGFEIPAPTKEIMCGKNSNNERPVFDSKMRIYRRTELEELSLSKIRKVSDLKKKQEKAFYSSIQDIVPAELLKKYINCLMGYENFQELCVQSFSSVVRTLGSQNWFMLRDAFLELAESKFSTRKTIASSLHELAAVLDEENVVKDLLPVFMMYILNDADEVYFKVFEHLADFLKLGGKDARTAFSGNLCRLPIMNVKSVNLWRHKLMLTEQLINVLPLYSLSEIQEYFLPFAVELLADKVSVVRQASIEMLAVIMKHLFSNKDTVIHVHQTLDLLLESHKKANKWMWRQLYVHMCEQLAIKESLTVDFYVNQIVPLLFSLIWDSVPNVRLSVARCISRSLIPLGYIPTIEKTHDQLLKQVLCALHSDVEKDVRYFALQALNALPSIVIDSVTEENHERNCKEEIKCISED